MDRILKELRTKEVINKYGLKFNKALGQNFLTDKNILNQIIEAAELTDKDSVIEIGPGIGALTNELSIYAGRVLAIEIDNNLYNMLNEIFRDSENLIIYEGDALKVDFKDLKDKYLNQPISICANLPYYITTPLIIKILECGIPFKNGVFMVQKEVAQRIVAKPNNKDYGALSILVQYYSRPEIITIVSPECFIPKPKVDSAVVKLNMYKESPYKAISLEFFFAVVRASFEQRRKTLNNSLKSLGLSKEDLNTAFLKSSIDSNRRGETLSIDEFIALANEMYILKKKL